MARPGKYHAPTVTTRLVERLSMWLVIVQSPLLCTNSDVLARALELCLALEAHDNRSDGHDASSNIKLLLLHEAEAGERVRARTKELPNDEDHEDQAEARSVDDEGGRRKKVWTIEKMGMSGWPCDNTVMMFGTAERSLCAVLSQGKGKGWQRWKCAEERAGKIALIRVDCGAQEASQWICQIAWGQLDRSAEGRLPPAQKDEAEVRMHLVRASGAHPAATPTWRRA